MQIATDGRMAIRNDCPMGCRQFAYAQTRTRTRTRPESGIPSVGDVCP